ncbi:MAG: hypothetical protein COW18_09770 [Zetaproteobacteria bacterium CG12_big_fil_rev_8_21_14_0_65_54_13]|nr:MAG: hypothetical protein COW18_09770 [Zetaproteobacteria bacterium CG12_big_fil_rev_8_21_14_0_65_54_13]PIX53884.1 MAG: hypothetical protein COZ50_10950 [Zetaproteobacteria bacterium CG_4_10_14_3_um_filter_54_28]PJA28593.1 MAG: hypothetical protein CO188_08935 [Zetaproteobacteria bacterium CG_4_9_14_3_um_filter_54_145]
MKSTREVPTSNEGWVIEIMDAYQDAKAALVFATAAGREMHEADLFHMAPLVCLKFRDLGNSKELRTKARDAAIGSYIANHEAGKRNLYDPVMAFSFCYMLAHYGIGLVGEEQCQDILQFVELNLAKIKTAIASLTISPAQTN